MTTATPTAVAAEDLLSAYAPIIGEEEVAELRHLGRLLSDRTVQQVNSTALGGGVAELLHRMVPLFQQLGVKTRWDIFTAPPEFFQITKMFHNALHGHPAPLTKQVFVQFLELSQEVVRTFPLQGDIVYVHDPQPIALIRRRRRHRAKWIWRCHVDVSAPNRRLWQFLQQFILRYDAVVLSAAHFGQRLPIRQFLVAPSIDPLSEKNRELDTDQVRAVFDRLQIPRDLPIVTQVSRFDRLKDPVGVITAFRLVRRYAKCRLVLVGGSAADDPEGAAVLAETRAAAANDPLIHVLELPPTSHLEINAIQRGSTIIVQKSLREGFGLTVAEALWKRKPVVASAVGGIPLQVIHQFSGLLCHSIEGAALAIRQLLRDPQLARQLGENGYAHVKEHFLVTRQVREDLLLMLALQRTGDIIMLS